MGWVKFTGDYPKLKEMGYRFQRLYAANYMTWNRGNLWIYKRGKDIIHGEFDLYDFISFIRTNPILRTSNMFGTTFQAFLITIDENHKTTYLPYTDENRKVYADNMLAWHEWDKDSGEPAPIYMSSKCVDDDLVAQLKELNDLGWYELVHEDMKA